MQTNPLLSRFSLIMLLSALFFNVKSQTRKLQDDNSPRVILESGTPIFLETNNEMSTKYLEFGMNICLYLKFPLKVNDAVVLPAGTPAFCRITRLEKPSGFGKSGILEIEPLYIQTFKGDILPIGSEARLMSGAERSTLANSMSVIGSSLCQLAMYKSTTHTPSSAPMFEQPNYNPSAFDGQTNALMVNHINEPIPAAPTSNGATNGVNLLNKVAGVAQVAAIVVPIVAFLIKGKHAKLPKGYIVRTQLISNTLLPVGY